MQKHRCTVMMEISLPYSFLPVWSDTKYSWEKKMSLFLDCYLFWLTVQTVGCGHTDVYIDLVYLTRLLGHLSLAAHAPSCWFFLHTLKSDRFPSV
jgi:hypothetical protein